MKKFSRKLIALFTMLTFVLQLFSPYVVLAQDAQTQKAEIQKAIDDFKPVYAQIMAVEPIELGGIANAAVAATEAVTGLVNDVVGGLTRESSEARAKREKEEEANKCKAQIAQANEDIKKLKADAKAVMEELKNGSIDAAKITDTAKSYDTFQKTGSGLATYQKTLRAAGDKLLEISGQLDIAIGLLGVTVAVLIAVSIPFPVVAPAAGILANVVLGVTIANGVLKAAGNSLITAAAKGATSDLEFVGIIGREVPRQAVETGVDIIMDKTGVGLVTKNITGGVVDGTLNASRELERTGATGDAALKIAMAEYGKAGASTVIDLTFAGILQGASKTITMGILSDPALDAAFNTNKAREDLYGSVKSVIGNEVDPIKSAVTDAAKEPLEAKPKPGLSGGGSW
ncbi:MAG: hypothetical protein WA705_29390 [Candidatus Ozemobacteraceae bacterium]